MSHSQSNCRPELIVAVKLISSLQVIGRERRHFCFQFRSALIHSNVFVISKRTPATEEKVSIDGDPRFDHLIGSLNETAVESKPSERGCFDSPVSKSPIRAVLSSRFSFPMLHAPENGKKGESNVSLSHLFEAESQFLCARAWGALYSHKHAYDG